LNYDSRRRRRRRRFHFFAKKGLTTKFLIFYFLSEKFGMFFPINRLNGCSFFRKIYFVAPSERFF